MIRSRILLACLALLGLTSCTAVPSLVAPRSQAGAIQEQLGEDLFDVVTLNVSVPRNLVVSEGSGYYPNSDIVWRGDPFGDRYKQIDTIFSDAMGKGVDRLKGDKKVVLDVVVERFHSVTERTRYTVGGVHSIRFNMTIRDAATGAVIESTRVVQADLNAFGGQTAIRAESAGMTQKVRISEHLERVILYEMTRPRDFLDG